MAQERLDKHDKIHHELFDEDTNQIGSLGDIVEKHAGDAVFLAAPEHSAGGADGGEEDFEAEMLAGGFQVESIPDRVLNLRPRPLADGEELDDYDDDADEGKDDAKGKLAAASEPFAHAVSTDPDADTEPTPDRTPVRNRPAASTDDALDATRNMK